MQENPKNDKKKTFTNPPGVVHEMKGVITVPGMTIYEQEMIKKIDKMLEKLDVIIELVRKKPINSKTTDNI